MRYPPAMPFSPDLLDLLERTEEVEIETHASGDPAHRTTIWIVVDGDVPFVRSVRGPAGRWYREALAQPSVTIHAAGQSIAARAVPAVAPDSIARCSAALRRKYAGDPSLDLMLRPEVLSTTLRLEPA